MKFIPVLTSIFLLFGLVSTSFACARFEVGVPLCAEYTKADAVFIGKAVKVEYGTEGDDGGRRIQFKVQHNFKGAENPILNLVTSDWRAACGLRIKKNQTWIIYANYNKDRKIFVSHNGAKYDAKKDTKVEELELSLNNNVNGEISGKLVSYGDSSRYIYSPAELTLEGNGIRQIINTNNEGEYRFSSLSAGNYKVWMKFPFRASLLWQEYEGMKSSFKEDFPSLLEYEVELNQGDCDFKFFEVFKYTKNEKTN
jgi:hypothetical protein